MYVIVMVFNLNIQLLNDFYEEAKSEYKLATNRPSFSTITRVIAFF